jgi:hypothetical protein
MKLTKQYYTEYLLHTPLKYTCDSVQDKRYSKFIELVKKQYSGNEHGTVRGINLVNFAHSTGNDGD